MHLISQSKNPYPWQAKPRQHGEPTGFSLVELVVVIAVLSILAAIGIPAFNSIVHQARISAIKFTTMQILRECIVIGLQKDSGPPTFNDLISSKTRVRWFRQGDNPEIGWGINLNGISFTFDTTLSSRQPIRPQYSCYRFASKSDTFEPWGGPIIAQYPHFEIFYNPLTGVIRKNCFIEDPSLTFNDGSCNPSAPSGNQW